MKLRISICLTVVLLWALIGCPTPPLLPTADKGAVLKELMDRRKRLGVIEADVKLRFPHGVFITHSLEGHAAYKLDKSGPMLRLVAFGPLGIQAFDLLVKDGDFLVKIPGQKKPLCQEDLCKLYGDDTITRTPSLLARIPGLFFGGVPDRLNSDWKFRREPDCSWVTSPDGDAFLVAGIPPQIIRAEIKEENIGTIEIELSGWKRSSAGLYPMRAKVKFDKRALFSFRLRNIKTGPSLPPDVFNMGASLSRPSSKLLILKAFQARFAGLK